MTKINGLQPLRNTTKSSILVVAGLLNLPLLFFLLSSLKVRLNWMFGKMPPWTIARQ